MKKKSFIQTLIEKQKKESEAKLKEVESIEKKENKRVSPIKGKIRLKRKNEKKAKWYDYEEVKDKVVRINRKWYWKDEIEKKEEAPKPEIKSENKNPEKETEEIRNKLSNVSEKDELEIENPEQQSPKETPKEEPPETPKEGFDIKGFFKKNDVWIWALGGILLLYFALRSLGNKNSSTTKPVVETKRNTEPEVEYEEINIAPPGTPPRIIRRPKL